MAPTATLAAVCDGTGACPAAKTQACTPFACGGDTCKQSCDTDADCDPAYRCAGKLCVVGATCKDSHTVLSGEKKTTECSPYACVAGKCNTTCNSVAECAEGFACNDTGQCVSVGTLGAGAGTDEGGCGCRIGGASPSRPRWGTFIGLFAAASIVTRRRRRQRVRA
jgi:MYXO-CTERM domain-containing protein